MWTRALLLTASSLLPFAAAFEPNVFFNWTVSPVDGMMNYKPAMYDDLLPPDNTSIWNVTWSDVDEANYKPGDLGRGKPLMVGTVKQGATNARLTAEGVVTARNMTAHIVLEAYIEAGWPDGFKENSSMSRFEVDNDFQGKYAAGSGPISANYTFDTYGFHSWKTTLETSPSNDSRLIIDHIDVGMGIQTEATSFENVKIRTEPFIKDGAINPFFECANGESGAGNIVGNFTTTSTPVDLVLILGQAACAFNAPSNVSLLVVNGYSRPDGNSRAYISTMPERPFPVKSLSNLEAFRAKYVAPFVADVIVLDPTKQYRVLTSAYGGSGNGTNKELEYLALESVAMYSGLADQEPPGGGGPIDWDQYELKVNESAAVRSTIYPSAPTAAPSSSSPSSTSSASKLNAASAGVTLLLAAMAMYVTL